MKLGAKQELFQHKIVELKLWLFNNSYEIRGGDAFRDARVHGAMGIQLGYGSKNSCHKLKLAEDLYIRKRSESALLSTFEEHLPIGEFWESIGGSWGGRFSFKDYVHFSFEHEGYK